jgi:hypothetical protein
MASLSQEMSKLAMGMITQRLFGTYSRRDRILPQFTACERGMPCGGDGKLSEYLVVALTAGENG